MRDREKHNAKSGESSTQAVCPSCGSTRLQEQLHHEKFTYGEDENAVELGATVPFSICESCGYQFFRSDAEDAKHDAVCAHLGVMSPQEVNAIRNRHQLSRA